MDIVPKHDIILNMYALLILDKAFVYCNAI